METLRAIVERRSTGKLIAPGPTSEQLDALLNAASHAPDHKTLHPSTFIVLNNELKSALGDVTDANKFERAPLVIAAVTRRVETVLPFEELLASTAAAIQNILLAATDLGLGSMWRTGGMAYDPAVKRALGVDEDDFISGFIYLGTPPSHGLLLKASGRPMIDPFLP